MRFAVLTHPPFGPFGDMAVADEVLTQFYSRGANRLMIYLCLTLLAGLTTLLALEIYGVLFQRVGSSITFRGVYAWETALNFGLCHLILDEGGYRLGAYWKVLRNRTLSGIWATWSMIFFVFMLVQRTVVYARTIHYHPTIVKYYNIYPEARPDWLSMTLFSIPFWLLMTALAQRLILTDHVSKPCPAEKASPEPLGVPAAPRPTEFVVNTGGRQTRILAETLTHITVEDHYCRFFIANNDTTIQVMALTPLKAVVDKLPPQEFLQIHRSHVVRLKAVSAIRRKGRAYRVSIIPGEVSLPISRQRLTTCLPVLKKVLGKLNPYGY